MQSSAINQRILSSGFTGSGQLWRAVMVLCRVSRKPLPCEENGWGGVCGRPKRRQRVACCDPFATDVILSGGAHSIRYRARECVRSSPDGRGGLQTQGMGNWNMAVE